MKSIFLYLAFPLFVVAFAKTLFAGQIFQSVGCLLMLIVIFYQACEVMKRQAKAETLPIKAATLQEMISNISRIFDETGYTPTVAETQPDFIEYLKAHGFQKPE